MGRVYGAVACWGKDQFDEVITLEIGARKTKVKTQPCEVAERLIASVSKTEIPARVSGVQIPPLSA